MIANHYRQSSLIDSFMPKVPQNEFLNNIQKFVDFESFRNILDACYSHEGRPACDPIILFKMLLLERWYRLSDREVVANVEDRITFRKFLCLELGGDVPDDTTLVRFRERLDKNKLFDKLINKFEEQLAKHNINIKAGSITIVDATLMEANTRQKQNDPTHVERLDPGAEIVNRPPKGPITGYKVHISMDAKTRMISQFEVTGAARAEVEHLLVPFGAEAILADKGYHSAKNRRKLKALGVRDCIMKRGARAHPLSEKDKQRNKTISPCRSKIESKFGEMKKWHGLGRAIYRGIQRVAGQVAMTILAVNMKRLVALMPV